MRRRVAITLAAAVVLSAARAAADPPVHLKSPSTVTTDKGSTLRLPPGYFLDEEKWAARDAEMKKAQEDATRFRAENLALRRYATDISWRTIGCALAFGAVAGVIGFQMVTK